MMCRGILNCEKYRELSRKGNKMFGTGSRILFLSDPTEFNYKSIVR